MRVCLALLLMVSAAGGWHASQQAGGETSPPCPVFTVTFSPDGKLLVWNTEHGIRVWDVGRDKQVGAMQLASGGVFGATFSPDGRLIATAGVSGVLIGKGESVCLWDSSTCRLVDVLKGKGLAFAVAFSPDGRFLATGSFGLGFGRRLELWKVANGEEVAAWFHSQGSPFSNVAFSPDGTLLATTTSGRLRLVDVASRRPVRAPKANGYLERVAFSPDGRELAAGDYEGRIHLWALPSWESYPTVETDSAVLALAYSPDGHTLATAGQDGVLRLWDMPRCELRRTLSAHKGGAEAEAVAFSPEGTRLASGGRDGVVRVWDVPSGAALYTIQPVDGPSAPTGPPDPLPSRRHRL